MDDRRGSVLVLTNSYDVTSDLVLRALAARGIPVVRLDPGVDPHEGASLSAVYGTAGQRGTLRTRSRALDLTRVRSVWVRRPSPYGGPPGLDEQDRRFAAEQCFWGTGGILASLPGAHYVNHPWHNRAAEHKPAQLAAAQRSGFLVPHTLITNDVHEARDFAAREPGGVVYKPVWNTPYRVDNKPHSVWVREVHGHDITSAVAVCPHVFQAKVDKAFDVRVTAVDHRLFGARIDSPDLDWRYRQDLMRCTPIAVPEAIARSVAAYLAGFRLVYGAFDFAVTTDDAWYFLECNPNGQWARQPAGITDAVARAIADQLQKGSDT
ncbi:ATP-grasp ribosomal peptide maturase [Streptomyces sp. N2-109]|uniref:ATP-grasp ribosomal peptide maturase n=1 Tax=Streptomyces gossypii TaxID=2883101 RepID=A0ABT2K153_9ACTN|nr:ATP-grasp ribosomal peptide maturase [Streptomyces gossypii]MCT2592978.1 ATP-grasp ribosomal peptide maturase [Streptomyces gossypii]MCT2593711.1 ATP-grasp ribosomal peptide maturase [Streptomyces gossypii]